MTKLYKAKEEPKKSKYRYPLIVLVAVLCVATMGYLWYQSRKDASNPDKAVLKLETGAESMGDEGDQKLEQEEGGGATSLSYADVATIDTSSKKIHLVFGNPSRSNYNAVVQVILEDTVIATSGRIEPGKQVRTLKLDERVKQVEGTYEGKMKIYFYEPDTNQREMVNTEIPIIITVQ